MKDICEGRRTKNDVVHESLEMYREVFMKANREVNVLVEVHPPALRFIRVMSAIPSGIKLEIPIWIEDLQLRDPVTLEDGRLI